LTETHIDWHARSVSYYDLTVTIAFCALVTWTAAAVGAGRLMLRGSPGAVAVRAGLGLAVVTLGLLLVVAQTAAVLIEGRSHGWSVAADLAVVALPPLLLPTLAVIALAIPCYLRVLRIRPPVAQRVAAADPRLVVPVQATAVGAAVCLVVVVGPPAEPYAPDLLLALIALAVPVAALLLWRRRLAREVADPGWRPPSPARRLIAGVVRAAAATVLIVALVAQAIWSSRVPGAITEEAHAGHGAADVTVDQLVTPRGPAVQKITLTAAEQTVKLASGESVSALAFNGRIPGPELRLTAGQITEVTLVNRNVAGGVTVHWHGLNVANAADGVAGVTQDAVAPGKSYVYRLRTDQVGTFWYHSHQQSATQVSRGLFGALIVEPPGEPAGNAAEHTVVAHAWDVGGQARTAFGDSTGIRRETAKPGRPVRLRLVNADNCPRRYAFTGAAFRVVAIDGVALNGPTDLAAGTQVDIGGGGRYDLEYTQPASPVQLSVTADDNRLLSPYALSEGCGGANGGGGPPQGGGGRGGGGMRPAAQTTSPVLLLAPDPAGEPVPADAGAPVFDPLGYGTPVAGAFSTGSKFDRSYELRLSQSYGFYDGRFTSRWSINNRTHPDIDPLIVREGELVKVRFVNRSQQDHPMHPHGHHMLVLSRNGTAPSGSPWWTDTLNVGPGETYEVAFRAGNPGIWMDHCHNLEHALAGMVMHLVYEGVSTPYRMGKDTPNQPE
jgi:FtsP/CotA-like multicopper oxidase with cupredoxin domain